MDPLTLAVGVGVTAMAGVGTGLRLRHRLRRAEAVADGLRRELEAEQYAAYHDSLTGLANRRAFYRLGSRLVADSARPAIACIVVDINSFKQVNDTLGHAAGDEVLVAVARRLARYGGTGGDDNLVARLGGDEFAGLFTHPTTDWALLYPAADNLADLLAAPMPVAGRRLHVTASVGAAAVTRDGGLATALHQADSAMYRAKATGTPAACFNPVLDGDAPVREEIRPDLPELDTPALDTPELAHLPGTPHTSGAPYAVERAVAAARPAPATASARRARGRPLSTATVGEGGRGCS